MDGTLLFEQGRYVLRFERHLSHPVQRVFRAVTEPAELARWFPGEVALDLAVGADVSFSQVDLDVDPDLLPTRGTVTELDPPRLFAFTWGRDLLRFELTAEGDGCRLVFTHSFADRASAPRSAAGWHVCLDDLVALLDGDAPDRRSWPEYYQRYCDEMGTDGVFVRLGERAELRFERLLAHSVTEVWSALIQPEALETWLAKTSIEPVAGSRVELRFATPAGYVVTGTVTRAEAPKVLEYTWTSPGEPDGVVRWQLIPVGDHCILLLTHTVHGHWDEAGTMAAWHVHLSLLSDFLAGQPRSPFPEDRWQELSKSYAGEIRGEAGNVSA